MGLTFKENCPDLRNTRVVDIVDELNSYNANVDVYDPWVDNEEARAEYGIDVIDNLDGEKYDAIILAVAHKQFLEMGIEKIRKNAKKEHVLFDIKHLLPMNLVDGRL
jgi:UDP-N-acetyl-D-galactosamine dehydrogenase